MQPLHFVLLSIVLIIVWLVYMAVKYGNPYKLIMVFGKKGSGKTTLLVKLAIKHLKRNWTVYSTCPVPGAYLIDGKDIGKYAMKKRSVVFVDEVGMLWDNRKFKTFEDCVRDWFKLTRQRQIKVYLFSQSFDVDVKIRQCTDSMYMCFNFCGWLSYAKEIRRTMTIVQPTEEAEGRIADGLKVSPFFMWIFGARILTYVPHWIPYFNTGYMAEANKLPEKEWPMVPPIELKKKRVKVKDLIAGVKDFLAENREFNEMIEKWNRKKK